MCHGENLARVKRQIVKVHHAMLAFEDCEHTLFMQHSAFGKSLEKVGLQDEV